MLFIELTSMADFKTFWLNAERIVHIEQGPNEADTIIQTATGRYHVSEHQEYIISVLRKFDSGCIENHFPQWATKASA